MNNELIEKIEKIKAVRTRLKCGEYNGNDIMQAWIAIDELIDCKAALSQQQEAEPVGVVPQDVEEFIAETACPISVKDEYGDTHYDVDSIDVDDLRTWMADHVRVPVEPNDAMQVAGASAIRIETTALNKLWTANAVFRAMINASKGE